MMGVPVGVRPKAWLFALRQQIAHIEGARPSAGAGVVSTGCAEMDALLPHGGARRGGLMEWLGQDEGSGAALAALIVARQACVDGKTMVVVDRRGWFYPPAASALGIDLDRLVVARPTTRRDALWAWDQALRCEAVSAAWGYVHRLEGRWFRRLQLAAEESGSVGLFVRPSSVVDEPSWADVRLVIEPRPSLGASPRFCVKVVRCHGGRGGQEGEFEIDHAGGTLLAIRGKR